MKFFAENFLVKSLLVQIVLIQMILQPSAFAQQQTTPTPVTQPQYHGTCTQLASDASSGLFIRYCIPFYNYTDGDTPRGAVFEVQGVRESAAGGAASPSAKVFRVLRVQNGRVSLVGEMNSAQYESTRTHIFEVNFSALDSALRFIFGLQNTESTPSGFSYAAALPAWAISLELPYWVMAMFGAPNLSVMGVGLRRLAELTIERDRNRAAAGGAPAPARPSGSARRRSAEEIAELATRRLDAVESTAAPAAAAERSMVRAVVPEGAGRWARFRAALLENLTTPRRMNMTTWAVRIGIGMTLVYNFAPSIYRSARENFARRMAGNARIRFAQRLDGLLRLIPQCVAADEDCRNIRRHLRLVDSSQAMAQAQANQQTGNAISAGETFAAEFEGIFTDRSETQTPATVTTPGSNSGEQGSAGHPSAQNTNPTAAPAHGTPVHGPVTLTPIAAPAPAPVVVAPERSIARAPIPVMAFAEFESSLNAFFRPACDTDDISTQEDRIAHCGRNNTAATVGFRQPIVNVQVSPGQAGLR